VLPGVDNTVVRLHCCHNTPSLSRDERCHFLRVDKEDFNRILRDVEAKTERLKENGRDVLVLEKLSRSDGSQR